MLTTSLLNINHTHKVPVQSVEICGSSLLQSLTETNQETTVR